MRWVFAMLAAIAACGGKKERAQPQAGSASGSGSAAAEVAAIDAAPPAVDAAPTGPVELLHAYTSFITVSSAVRNKTIKPEHLVDRDTNTAWNSKTGELVGAWLEVSVPSAKIHELRLTVGHTGKGPKGEDYFTLNPRIRTVSVLDKAGKILVTAPLDPESRALQPVKLPAPATGRLRVRVDDVVMGTKKTWREVCVSELEAWGMPPGDTPEPRQPFVSVYQPTPLEAAAGKPLYVDTICAEYLEPLEEAYRDRNRTPSEHETEDAPPACGLVDREELDTRPWRAIARLRMADNEAHGPMTCNFVASTDVGDFLIGPEASCGPWDEGDLRLASAELVDALPGGTPELVVRYHGARHEDRPVMMFLCRIANDAVQCTGSYEIEGATWKVTPRFAKGMVIFDPVEGKPPPAVSGPHAIDFGQRRPL